MKNALLFLLLITMTIQTKCQQVVELPYSNPTDLKWQGGEKDYVSKIWNTHVITNVSKPTLQIYKADPTLSTGTAVVVAPGGGLYAHSIDSEGIDVAKWLNRKGITALVLKYRLFPTQEDATKEISQTTHNLLKSNVQKILPWAIDDALAAIDFTRKNAKDLGVSIDKIGLMGFSAGGLVTMGATFNCTTENCPDFIVPVYPWMIMMDGYEVPENAPPMLVICAADDPLKLAEPSVDLYSDWRKKDKKAELHIYSKGGHGFGMKTQNLPSDNWIERFYDWALAEQLVTTKGNN